MSILLMVIIAVTIIYAVSAAWLWYSFRMKLTL